MNLFCDAYQTYKQTHHISSFCFVTQEIDLSFNQLTGIIPSSMGQLIQLQVRPVNVMLSLSCCLLLCHECDQCVFCLLSVFVSRKKSIEWEYTIHTRTAHKSLGLLCTCLPVCLSACLSVLQIIIIMIIITAPQNTKQKTQKKGLKLNSNELDGTIPPSLSNLTLVIDFWLLDNRLTGSIPPELGNLRSCQKLYLHRNFLTGHIPPTLLQITGLLVTYYTLTS